MRVDATASGYYWTIFIAQKCILVDDTHEMASFIVVKGDTWVHSTNAWLNWNLQLKVTRAKQWLIVHWHTESTFYIDSDGWLVNDDDDGGGGEWVACQAS